MSKPEPAFLLRLRPLPASCRTEPILRLRAELKRLSRDYGLRAIECRPDQPSTTTESETLRQRQGAQGSGHLMSAHIRTKLSMRQ